MILNTWQSCACVIQLFANSWWHELSEFNLICPTRGTTAVRNTNYVNITLSQTPSAHMSNNTKEYLLMKITARVTVWLVVNPYLSLDGPFTWALTCLHWYALYECTAPDQVALPEWVSRPLITAELFTLTTTKAATGYAITPAHSNTDSLPSCFPVKTWVGTIILLGKKKQNTHLHLAFVWNGNRFTPGSNDSEVDTGFYRLWLQSTLMETWHLGEQAHFFFFILKL